MSQLTDETARELIEALQSFSDGFRKGCKCHDEPCNPPMSCDAVSLFSHSLSRYNDQSSQAAAAALDQMNSHADARHMMQMDLLSKITGRTTA